MLRDISISHELREREKIINRGRAFLSRGITPVDLQLALYM